MARRSMVKLGQTTTRIHILFHKPNHAHPSPSPTPPQLPFNLPEEEVRIAGELPSVTKEVFENKVRDSVVEHTVAVRRVERMCIVR